MKNNNHVVYLSNQIVCKIKKIEECLTSKFLSISYISGSKICSSMNFIPENLSTDLCCKTLEWIVRF